MCENSKDLNTRKENEAMLCEILAQYEQKNDDIYTEGQSSKLQALSSNPEAKDLDLGSYGHERNDSIYSTEELYDPQELMAVVFLGTN